MKILWIRKMVISGSPLLNSSIDGETFGELLTSATAIFISSLIYSFSLENLFCCWQILYQDYYGQVKKIESQRSVEGFSIHINNRRFECFQIKIFFMADRGNFLFFD